MIVKQIRFQRQKKNFGNFHRCDTKITYRTDSHGVSTLEMLQRTTQYTLETRNNPKSISLKAKYELNKLR